MKTSLQESIINKIRYDISHHRISCYSQLANVLQIPHLIGEGGIFPSLKAADRVSVAAFNAMVEMLPMMEERHSEGLKLRGAFHGEHEIDKHGWIPPRSPEQKATLFPHQIKAAKDTAYRLFIEQKRGALIIAEAGHGKTFIYGQLIRWLKDKKWFDGCYSPWKCLIITKSAQETLVKQTEHVMVDFFGLNIPRDVYVMSYDALRSGKGLSRMMRKEKKHVDGSLQIIYSWIEELAPKLVIVDESQAARRRTSIQSQIIRGLARLPGDFKVVFSSATPFTTVMEAEYIATNVGLEV